MAGLTVTDITKNYLKGQGKKIDESVSNLETQYITVTFPNPYTTGGGEAFDARSYSRDGATEPIFVEQNIAETATANAAYYLKYDAEAHTLLAYDADSEVGAVSLTGLTKLLRLTYKY